MTQKGWGSFFAIHLPLLLLFLFLILILFFLTVPAFAQNDPDLSVRLISEKAATGDGVDLLLGLELQLAPETHTYWRTPGPVGVAPKLDWSGSQNLKDATLLYPFPTRYVLAGMESFGYDGQVVFPIRVNLENPKEALKAKLSLDLLICNTQCIPKHFDLALALPTGKSKDSADASLIQDALKKIPVASGENGLTLNKIEYTDRSITFDITSDRELGELPLFWEDLPDFDLTFGAPEIVYAPDHKAAKITVYLQSDLPEGMSLKTIKLQVTLVDQDRAITFPVAYQPRGEAPVAPSFAFILLLALLGGLILNLMPCVLPVLSLKLLSVIKHGGSAKKTVRHSFSATALGILFSFLLLAAATIGLKFLGHAVGWGVQFQQPLFLVFMILLLGLFTANLWGFFEVTLPRWIMDSVDPSHHPKLAGDFATGMLATLLATPCSAPFLGTAIGFALSAGALEIFSVFAALGIGMALPYWFVAFFPQTASLLPRPGMWMVKLTRALGFLLFATMLWLLYVLHVQTGWHMVALIFGATLVIFALLYLRHTGRGKKLVWPLVLVLAAASLSLSYAVTLPQSLSEESVGWERFDEAQMHRYVREGKTVFIDITADWCLTCKANKRFALSNEEVRERLFDNDDVIAMQGDWTTPDPVLAAFLHKHGRYGIPFNAVFGPKAPDGIFLSELLTPSAVLEALDKAKEEKPRCPVNLPPDKRC